MLQRTALILVLGFWSLAATAQVPIVEAGSRRGQQAAAEAPQGGNNDLLYTLYTQMEALQQEVLTLRGMVEEQANLLRRVQTEQRDRYLDVDRRLSELSAGGAALPGANFPVSPDANTAGAFPPPASSDQFPPATTPPNEPPPAPAISLGNAAPPAAAAPQPGAELGEEDLYRTALNLLLEQNQSEESIRLFQAYIDRYPQGRRLTNAYYWQGEAFILVSRFDEARDVFMRLINDYPQDAKAADAMLKLGVVYQRTGDRARAEQIWREISTRYPENVTVIRAAQDYMNRR